MNETENKLKSLAMARKATDLSSIKTKQNLLLALRKARNVYIFPRFGVVEYPVKLSKPEAEEFIKKNIKDDQTPDDLELFAGDFGSFKDDDLYLG
jgi:hypothetical protein